MSNEAFLEKISLEGEEWRDVVGYEGFYAVSNFGRVAFLSRTVKNGQGIKYIPSRLCKLQTNPNGYIQARLWLNNKERKMYIHRLVAEAFMPNPNNLPQVDHINTVRNDNRLENLRWVSASDNHLNPITRERNSKSKIGHPALVGKGSKPVVRINPNDPTDYKIFESAKRAGEIEGYNSSHIGDVCQGRRNKAQGFFWKFLSDFKPPISDVNVLFDRSGE